MDRLCGGPVSLWSRHRGPGGRRNTHGTYITGLSTYSETGGTSQACHRRVTGLLQDAGCYLLVVTASFIKRDPSTCLSHVPVSKDTHGMISGISSISTFFSLRGPSA